jgi:CHASE2 domain-containing sensor protein
MQNLRWEQPYAQSTFVVTVGDDDYWKGEFNAREPIRRDLLAHVLEKLSLAKAKAVAIDFDLESPVPDGSIREVPAYLDETIRLVSTMDSATKRHTSVVLPSTIGYDKRGMYVLESDVYSGYPAPQDHFFKGYIALPPDARLVPLEITLAGGNALDSFALAAVRAYDGRAVARIKNLNVFPYGGYIRPGLFPQMNVHDVLTSDTDAMSEKVAGKLVFVGANWHRYAWRDGPLVDTHMTPVGLIPGVFVHANYAEAIIDGSDLYQPMGEWLAYILEVLVLFAVSLVFVAEMHGVRKIVWLTGLSLLFVVVAYVMLQNLGIYFDYLVPLVLLFAHFGIDKISEWRKIALDHIRNCQKITQEASA